MSSAPVHATATLSTFDLPCLFALQLAAPDNLEQQFQALEGDSVDNELAAMKSGRSLKGGNGSKAQLPEGRPYDQVFKKDAIDEVRTALSRVPFWKMTMMLSL